MTKTGIATSEPMTGFIIKLASGGCGVVKSVTFVEFSVIGVKVLAVLPVVAIRAAESEVDVLITGAAEVVKEGLMEALSVAEV